MKAFAVGVILSFLSFNLFSQTLPPTDIEADLLNSFKKISSWNKKFSSTYDDKYLDSLVKANSTFREKLMEYTKKYPITIGIPFKSLLNEDFKISTSVDKLFRIYSWDNQQSDFDNLIQYQSGAETKCALFIDTVKVGDEGYVGEYRKLYQMKSNNKTYYIVLGNLTYSKTAYGMGVRIFAIENGFLNDDVKIIKTKTGLHSRLYFDYDLFSASNNWKEYPTFLFDNLSKTIKVPIVAESGKAIHRYITYKFTGKYFEKVKN